MLTTNCGAAANATSVASVYIRVVVTTMKFLPVNHDQKPILVLTTGRKEGRRRKEYLVTLFPIAAAKKTKEAALHCERTNAARFIHIYPLRERERERMSDD
jgi:hypothetical protein